LIKELNRKISSNYAVLFARVLAFVGVPFEATALLFATGSAFVVERTRFVPLVSAMFILLCQLPLKKRYTKKYFLETDENISRVT